MHKKNRKISDKFYELASIITKNERNIYFALAILCVILWVSFAFDFINLKKISAFAIFVIVGGFFKYIISRFRIFVEFTPIAFFAVIIAKYMGIFWVIIYLVIADVVPSFLGHYGPDHASIPHWIWVFIFSIIVLPLDITNMFIRIIVPIAYFIGCVFIEQFALGGLNGEKWASSFVNLAINFYFFVKLAEFFIGLTI